jgi:IclR family KDG regulon transcriptional repressor
MMKAEFKRVPAVDKCFGILELFAKEKKPLGISDISAALALNKSTVFNIVYTLTDLNVLENTNHKFRFGPKLYMLGKAAEKGSELILTVHPYLEEISRKTNLSSFLGMRSGLKAIILDKVDAAFELKISSEIGIRLSLLAGSGGKALLSQLSDTEIDEILSENGLKRFTPFSCVDKETYKDIIRKVREDGIALDKEEYLEGIRALAVPIKVGNRRDLQVAIWAVGLKRQVRDEVVPLYSRIMKGIAKEIEMQFSV